MGADDHKQLHEAFEALGEVPHEMVGDRKVVNYNCCNSNLVLCIKGKKN